MSRKKDNSVHKQFLEVLKEQKYFNGPVIKFKLVSKKVGNVPSVGCLVVFSTWEYFVQ